MQLGNRFTAKAALAITVCWVALLAVTGATETLLFLAPALLIAIPLLCGHYVGEELIVKLAVRRADRRPRPAKALPARRAPIAWLLRGTRLIATSLAKRPPPARALLQS